MADGLSAEDRALIDAFVVERGVTKVPRGASSNPQPRYDADRNEWYSICGLTGRRLSPREVKQRWHGGGTSALRNKQRGARIAAAERATGDAPPPPRAVSDAVAARRDRVAEMRETMTAAEMADRLGVSIGTIHNDMAALNKAGRLRSGPGDHVLRAKAAGGRAAVAKRQAEADAKILPHVAPGLTQAEIARRAGVSQSVVNACLKRNGVVTGGKPGPKPQHGG